VKGARQLGCGLMSLVGSAAGEAFQADRQRGRAHVAGITLMEKSQHDSHEA
jgi:hypothetical protein